MKLFKKIFMIFLILISFNSCSVYTEENFKKDYPNFEYGTAIFINSIYCKGPQYKFVFEYNGVLYSVIDNSGPKNYVIPQSKYKIIFDKNNPSSNNLILWDQQIIQSASFLNIDAYIINYYRDNRYVFVEYIINTSINKQDNVKCGEKIPLEFYGVIKEMKKNKLPLKVDYFSTGEKFDNYDTYYLKINRDSLKLNK